MTTVMWLVKNVGKMHHRINLKLMGIVYVAVIYYNSTKCSMNHEGLHFPTNIIDQKLALLYLHAYDHTRI